MLFVWLHAVLNGGNLAIVKSLRVTLDFGHGLWYKERVLRGCSGDGSAKEQLGMGAGKEVSSMGAGREWVKERLCCARAQCHVKRTGPTSPRTPNPHQRPLSCMSNEFTLCIDRS